MTEYTSYAQMTEAEYSQWLKEFTAENGEKPNYYDFQDFVEDDAFNCY
jgi:hypothetical protein